MATKMTALLLQYIGIDVVGLLAIMTFDLLSWYIGICGVDLDLYNHRSALTHII